MFYKILLFLNLGLLLLLYGRAVTAEITANEKCPYKDTVDLTDQLLLENGSYVYHDIVIPETRVGEYNYRLSFRNEKQTADLHVRGCVCGMGKYCVKLCCERGEFFNETSNECEKIVDDFHMPTDMMIILKSDVGKQLNIFENFIYQVGTPCEYPESLSMEVDKWELMEDGILHVLNDGAYLDTVSYCLTPYLYEGANEYTFVPMSCPIKNEMDMWFMLNTYAMAISVVFFIPTILVYLLVKELRGNMRGKLLISYLLSLIGGYSIISFINISGFIFEVDVCTLMGYICYFFFIAAFLWLSVLCFDIWINFKEHSIEFTKRNNLIRFIWYSVYAWGSAALMTLFAMWAQWSEMVADTYKPGIGVEVCWLDTNKWSAAIFFYFPNLVILLFNIATFIHLTLRIYRVRRDMAKFTQKQQLFKENAAVILRLFIIMGISWIMDIISYCLRDFHVSQYFFILTDFCNAIQGVLIFVLFVLKRNVYEAIKKSFSTSTTRKPRRSISSITTQFSKVSTSTSNA